MQVEFLDKFYKDLDKVPSSIKYNVNDVVNKLELAKRISEISNTKKLSGHKSAYRIRIGDYRIGIFITNNIVEFARIVHRKDIYDVFP